MVNPAGLLAVALKANGTKVTVWSQDALLHQLLT